VEDAARRLVRAVAAFGVAAAWAHRHVNCVFPAAAAFSYHAACPWCYWHVGVDSCGCLLVGGTGKDCSMERLGSVVDG